MSAMFHNATSFDQDLSGWDVRNVACTRYIFEECPCTEEHQPKF